MFILSCTLFHNNEWLFLIPVPAHHPQMTAVVFGIIGTFLSPVLQFLHVFLSVIQLEEAKSYMGGRGNRTCLEAACLSLRKKPHNLRVLGEKQGWIFSIIFLIICIITKNPCWLCAGLLLAPAEN